MIVNHKRDMGKLFRIGEEILTYRTREELQGLLRHYLANEDERAAIARRGRERARRDHTCSVRFNRSSAPSGSGGFPPAGGEPLPDRLCGIYLRIRLSFLLRPTGKLSKRVSA